MSTKTILRQYLVPVGRTLCRARSVPTVLQQRNFLPVRRGGNDPFTEIQRSFDQLFRDMERSFFPSIYQQFRSPLERAIPMETIENGQRMFRIEIDLPDFKPENVNVTVKRGEVKIEANLEQSEGQCKQTKKIQYCYSLPEDADLDKVRSVLKTDGRLVVEAPLPQLESKKPENQEIPIKRE